MKNILKGLFVLLLFFTFNRVNASTISIDDFIESYKKTDIVSLITYAEEGQEGNTLSIDKDESNHKLIILINNQPYVSLDYTDEYIQYTDLDTVLTEEVVSDPNSMASLLLVTNMLYGVLDANNFKDKDIDIPENVDLSTTYDEFGISSTSESYNFTREENGETISNKGDYIRTFKISLDSSKIEHLVNTYGVARGNNVEVPSGLKPSITVTSVEDTSVFIHFDLETNDEVEYMCQLYRSTSEDGEYVIALNGMSIGCKDPTPGMTSSISDDGLTPNTTYYYKAKVVGGDTFSDVISAKTNGTNSTNNSENNSSNIVNPKTGDASSIIYVSILLVISLIGLIIVSKSIHSKTL